jgi:hypothetical protein
MPYKSIEDKRKWFRDYYAANKKKRQATAKVQRDKVHQWYLELKKTFACIRCGENHPACLDFHHRDPSIKRGNISQLSCRGSRNLILREIEKCDCLCANCHRKEEWARSASGNTLVLQTKIAGSTPAVSTK